MTTPRHRLPLLLLAALAALTAGAAEPPPGEKKVPVPTAKSAVLPAPPPLSPRFKQVRERIDALFLHRNEPPPPIDPRKNPFRPAGATPVAVLPGGGPTANLPPPPPPPSADLDVLRLGAAALKVAGTVQINGRAHLIINQAPYKEGDVLNVRVKGQPVYLRVKNISRYSYTLSLNEAEISVKY